jgi:Raf kinase inhibitor-like YbhB/YbcL family protein
MRRTLLGCALAALVLTACGMEPGGTGTTAGATTATEVAPVPASSGPTSTIEVTSDAFAEGAPIPERFTCKGAGERPALTWTAVPAAAKSVAVVVDDPDANGFVHWILAGLAPASRRLPASPGPLPPGSVEVQPWRGPCPPSGTHHYQFTVYALPEALPLEAGDNGPEAIEQISANAIDRGRLVGTFGS